MSSGNKSCFAPEVHHFYVKDQVAVDIFVAMGARSPSFRMSNATLTFVISFTIASNSRIWSPFSSHMAYTDSAIAFPVS